MENKVSYSANKFNLSNKNINGLSQLTPTTWILILILSVAGAISFTSTMLSPNIYWHIQAAHRLINGGVFMKNIIDDNTPATYWFWHPVIWITKSLPSPQTVRMYAYLTMWLSIMYSLSIFYKRRTYQENKTMLWLLLVTSIFTYSSTIGDRDKMTFILSLPYLMSMINRIEFKVGEGKTTSIINGLLLGFATSMNPFYVLIPAASYLFIICYEKKISWPNLSTCIAAATFVCILAISYVLYPEYFKETIPFVYKYSAGYDFPLISVILKFNPIIILIVTSIFFCFTENTKKYNTCYFALTLLFTWSLLYIFPQRKAWASHYTTIIGFEAILISLIISKQEIKYKIALPKKTLERLIYLAILLAFINVIYSSSFMTQITSSDMQNTIQIKTQELILKNKPKSVYTICAEVNNNWILKTKTINANPDSATYLANIINKTTFNSLSKTEQKQQTDFLRNFYVTKIVASNPDAILTCKHATAGGTPSTFGYIKFLSKNAAFAKFFRQYTIKKENIGATLYMKEIK